MFRKLKLLATRREKKADTGVHRTITNYYINLFPNFGKDRLDKDQRPFTYNEGTLFLAHGEGKLTQSMIDELLEAHEKILSSNRIRFIGISVDKEFLPLAKLFIENIPASGGPLDITVSTDVKTFYSIDEPFIESLMDTYADEIRFFMRKPSSTAIVQFGMQLRRILTCINERLYKAQGKKVGLYHGVLGSGSVTAIIKYEFGDWTVSSVGYDRWISAFEMKDLKSGMVILNLNMMHGTLIKNYEYRIRDRFENILFRRLDRINLSIFVSTPTLQDYMDISAFILLNQGNQCSLEIQQDPMINRTCFKLYLSHKMRLNAQKFVSIIPTFKRGDSCLDLQHFYNWVLRNRL